MYLILENGTQLPIEEDKDLKPISIKVSFAEDSKSNWLPPITVELDEGSPTLAIPLPILKSMGILVNPESLVTIGMADGQQSQAVQISLSIRITTTDNEIVTLHEVSCLCPQDGDSILLGRDIQQVFKKVVVQNNLRVFTLNPKIKSWLGLSESS